MITNLKSNQLSKTDRDVLEIINTGPVTLKYIQRMLRLSDVPWPNIHHLQQLGYLKPTQPDTVGFYLTADGHRALLKNA